VKFRLLTILLVLGLFMQTAAMAREPSGRTHGNRLNDLALAVANGHIMLRVDLAQIALTELAATYDDEARRARQDMRTRAKKPGLGRWSAEVQSLAEDYRALAESISQYTTIDINIGAENSLYLTIDGRLVAVSSPRMNEQSAFEQNIIAQFCALNRCEELLEMPMAAAAKTVADRAGTTRWSFSQNAGPVCEGTDGLQFQFSNMDNLGRKRDVCARTVTELNTLTAALATKLEFGVRIDWERIMIRSLPGGEEQVTLNREGDYIQQSLPTLAQRRDLFRLVRPWLAAKAKGTPYPMVVLNAGRLLGEPGYPLE
jgi:hypothetical protein